MLGDFRTDELAAMPFEPIERAFLVGSHRPRVVRHIGGEYHGETALDGLSRPPPAASAGPNSVAVCDQLRAIDKRRLTHNSGRLSTVDLQMIAEGIRRVLEL